jgi:cytidylate kinase
MTQIKWPHRPHARNVGAIVENQVRRWAFNNQKRASGALPEHWPVVTISRECGTQGTALGRRVAERLGFSCWDSEIVTEIARLLHTDETTVAAFDEHTRGAIEDLIGSSIFQNIMSADYAVNVRRVIDSIARRGSAVIVGRGAQFIVDPNRALRVRLVAPFEHRVREVETLNGIASEAAKRIIESGDKERAAFVRQITEQNVADPAQYDVVINTGIYEGERADALVLMAYLAKFGELPLTEHVSKLKKHPTGSNLRPETKQARLG